MIEKDLTRVKDLIKSADTLDMKIGIGLALEKGMTYEELADLCIDMRMEEISDSNRFRELITEKREEIKVKAVEGLKRLFNE